MRHMNAPCAAFAALVVLSVLSACGSSRPTTISANFGPMPTDVPPPSEDVFGFQPAGPTLRHGSKLEFLVFDTEWDISSLFDRWAEVKALSQFGTWSGLKAGAVDVPTGIYLNVSVGRKWPTLDLSSARYRSRYVAFVHWIVQTKENGPPRRLPPTQEALLAHYGRLSESGYPQRITPWPVIIVGGLAMHGIVSDPPSDLCGQNVCGSPRTFQWLRRFVAERRPDPEQAYWQTPLNDFANTIVTAICHANGGKPANACNRPVIRAIERRLR